MPVIGASGAARHALAAVRGAAAESFMPLLRAVHGDITSLTVDAVVNAANATAAVRDLSSLDVIFCCYSRADLAIYQRLLRGDRQPRA